MNRRNPLDRFFQRKLRYHAVEPPMALWERIDAEREQQKRLASQSQKRQSTALLLLAAGAGLYSLWSLPAALEAPVLHSFPIWISPAVPSVPDPANSLRAVAVASLEAELPEPVSSPLAERLAEAAPLPPEEQKLTSVALPIEPVQHTAADGPSFPEQSARLAVAALPPLQPVFYKRNRSSEDVKCADFDPGEKGKWTLDILASPDWSFRRLEPKAREYAEYVANRQATESPYFSYSAGVRLSYVHPSGFLGRIGLNYSQINEKFEYRTESEEIITIRNIFGSNGEVVGTDTLIETSIRRSFSNNRFETVDIPVIVGYEKNFKKLSVTVNAGVLFNVSFHSKGDFLSPMDGEPVSFDADVPGSYPAFRERLGVGVYAGFSLGYHISPKLQLLLEPHLKTYPKTITQDQYMVSQQYLLTGLSVGLRHEM